jgi:ectoine hydroxylase-related dioxygenase (phytanoyl-CoA dioxygenase family)
MRMNDYKQILTEGEGYKVLPSFIPRKLINDFKNRLKDLYPVRASSSKKFYAERDAIKELKDISVWWSQTVDHMPEAQAIFKLIDPMIKTHFTNMDMYANDTVFISAGSTWMNPHIDTPHRFHKYNFDKRLLGIQCIVSLDHLDKDSASTGIVPYSQKRDFDIDKCYNGTYDRWFKENVIQPDMPTGSLLFYNCRVLHSSMPNPKQIERPALLFNYLDRSIMSEIKSIDNIWSSNGKSS